MNRRELENLINKNKQYRFLTLQEAVEVDKMEQEEDPLPYNLPFINKKGRVDYLLPGEKYSFER
ncbi:hypothetical protein [Peptostreptococcus sp. D1]|uniref:hypothetical protein n=1 Tax=Peptostreptococcus sp. D1 TaxID=72304 RepID=UPI0008E88821|nr:hypothetical protein [Peptostreptococcus sp. D1]SFE89453.1 hypothetical protein SAMN02910278_01984 [Peptostreptococcus sp. D1]